MPWEGDWHMEQAVMSAVLTWHLAAPGAGSAKIDALSQAPLKSDQNHVAAALNSYTDPFSPFKQYHPRPRGLCCTYVAPGAPI